MRGANLVLVGSGRTGHQAVDLVFERIRDDFNR
jgi:hypothetical protein